MPTGNGPLMTGPSSAAITRIDYWPVDIPITDPFVVATGARVVAENVFVRITLSNGTCGYGEAAPFPEVGAKIGSPVYKRSQILHLHSSAGRFMITAD